MPRIFVAGFHHETNTFAPSPADWAAFNAGAGYAAYTRGETMLRTMTPAAVSIGGFAAAAAERGWTLVPSVWAGAMPSNRVTDDAFERICGEIVQDLKHALNDTHAGGIAAIYLDLHGAAVAESADDAEGELLQRLRAVAGDALPIVASLDLHANVTERMLRLTNAMTAFRTYPHVDMRETGVRAAELLARRLAAPQTARAMHAERVPFLLPLNAQCTLMAPAAEVIALIAQLEAAHRDVDLELNFAMGFSAADFAECGPVLFGYGTDATTVRDAVQRLHAAVVAARPHWRPALLSPDEAVEQAIALAANDPGPVVIADTQDNPGAGGDSNTTGLLRALLAADAGRRLEGRVALGLLFDPASAAAACAAGIGATLALQLGRAVPTWTGEPSDPPVHAPQCRVLAVSDGVIPLFGPMTAGATMTLGPSACVEVDGVRLLLSSAKAQMLDLDLFRFLGVEPAQMKLLVVKSSVHFRAAFAPIASHILVAKAPGPMAADPGDLPWRHLSPATATRP
ncbi:MAG TPA: M81 family metallopeptidase [Burkholderiaceae bacterium]